jgi:hypothetical protein
MKPTGKTNPITGDEIFRAEESDIDFWETKWSDLTLEQKTMFLSVIGALFLGKQNEAHVKARYGTYRLKNISKNNSK